MTRSAFHHHDGRGGIHESDLIECTAEEWADMPESSDRQWAVIRPGPGRRVLRALRLPEAFRAPRPRRHPE
jgi:hypothetical protein